MIRDSKINELITMYRMRMKLAKEKSDLEVALIYAGVINELLKLMEH